MYTPSVHAIVHVHAQTHVISIQLQNGGVFTLDLENWSHGKSRDIFVHRLLITNYRV